MTDIIERLNAACVGHPAAKIPWPHRLLHDARAEIERLRAENEQILMRAGFARNRLEMIADESWHGDGRDLKRSIGGVFAELKDALDAAPGQMTCPHCESALEVFDALDEGIDGRFIIRPDSRFETCDVCDEPFDLGPLEITVGQMTEPTEGGGDASS